MSKNELYRKTVAEIDLSALAFNVSQIKKQIGPKCEIMAIVKANAYGHGDVLVVRKLEKLGISYFGVAYVEEGIRLRASGVKGKIVVLTGGQKPDVFEALHRYYLTPVIYHEPYLKAYDLFCRKKKKRGKIHLKIDTGMNRLGIVADQALSVLKSLKKYKNLQFEGVFSHIANAERPSHHNQEQILEFKKMVSHSSVKFKYQHLANTGSLLNQFGIEMNMVRPGLALYGAYPLSTLRKKMKLKAVMTLKSEVIQLKNVKRGDYISYGYTHQFKRDGCVATIPVGYADGYMRFFSNKGEVLIHGKRAPIVGIVCMDVFMVDVTDIQNVSIGDEVVLLGKQKKEHITVEDLAERIHSIPWEIFCNLSDRIPRVVVQGRSL